jgi:hypothetical protein
LALDQEKIKSLIAFKKRMEEQLDKLTAESEEVQAALDTVNAILLEKGFRRGDIKEVHEVPVLKEVVLPKQESEPPKVVVQHISDISKPVAHHIPEQETVIPLKTMADEPLALIIFDKPPFSNFLVEKIFAKMQEKDNELFRTNQLAEDKMFSYHVVREGDLIREIIIKNVDDERLKELKSSIRWTFEKMYEKIKSA